MPKTFLGLTYGCGYVVKTQIDKSLNYWQEFCYSVPIVTQ